MTLIPVSRRRRLASVCEAFFDGGGSRGEFRGGKCLPRGFDVLGGTNFRSCAQERLIKTRQANLFIFRFKFYIEMT